MQKNPSGNERGEMEGEGSQKVERETWGCVSSLSRLGRGFHDSLAYVNIRALASHDVGTRFSNLRGVFFCDVVGDWTICVIVEQVFKFI